MQIAIHAGGMPFNGATIAEGKSLGGSESAAYYMAKELKALGHTVCVFTTSQETGSWDGVRYEWCGEIAQDAPLGHLFHYSVQAPHDVVIVQRHPMAFSQPVNSKLNIWWLHDLATFRNGAMVDNQARNIDLVFCVSEFHKAQVSKVYGIDPEKIIATHNGVDYSLFTDLDLKNKERKSLFYMARPERGLENLVGPDGIMEKLPDHHLYVCGYDNTTREMESYYKYLWARCEELPNVTNLGALGKADLYKALSRTELYVYPTEFEDTSCIAVLEAMAAGVPVICSDIAALPETTAGGGARLIPLTKQGAVDKEAFVQAIKDFHDQSAMIHFAKAKRQTWKSAAERWNLIFHSELEEKSSDFVRVAKHLEHTSDIVALCHLFQEEVGDDCFSSILEYIPDFKENYGFLVSGDFKGHYQRYYEYEKARGVVYGPENLDGNARFECISDMVKAANPKKVLDYGCAHGHYTVNLAKRFPDVVFHGVDINASNIITARKWAEDEGMQERVVFIEGEHNSFEGTGYDLIIAAEVLEHVLDPIAVVRELRKRLSKNGRLVISTPYGPWEAAGYEKHKGWRAHIHHFERADLYELFGDQPGYRLFALPHTQELGHFVLFFDNSSVPFGKINYPRKLSQLAPRETLSACLIVKNAEHTIGKTIRNLRKIADEIIVGIDDSTTDDTESVCSKLGVTHFSIQSPMVQGFDAARNMTISRAIMNWILWIDDDESLEWPENISQYLRNSLIDGCGIPQNHYSVEPNGLLKTDYPVRLFRNNKGIKFYGHVHEHPEKKINEGVGKTIIVRDVAIMHTGYSTEAVRRERFKRNFPLMQEDRRKYPDRILGKFLWMRDLMHVVRYTMEMNGGRITEDIRTYCQTAIQIWKELLPLNSRMACEGLQYYSQAVYILTEGRAIEYTINLAASRNNGGAKLSDTPLTGKFLNTDDLRSFTNMMVDSAIGSFDERYF